MVSDYEALREPLWDAIVKVRDKYPRVSDDAPTDVLVDVVLEVLKSHTDQIVRENAAEFEREMYDPDRRITKDLPYDAMDEDRAVRHHYVTYEVKAREAGTDEDTILRHRFEYIEDALKDPDTVKLLREMYP